MITVVILALNEEAHLQNTVTTIMEAAREAHNTVLDIIIVNDGSSDGTAGIISRLEGQHPCIRSIHHATNLGPGIGVKKAITMAKYPKLISVPGDDDLSKDLVRQLFLSKDKADMIMAYYSNMQQRGWFRSRLSWAYTGIYRMTFNIPIHYINSPCLYPTDKLRTIKIHSDRFGYSAEMTVKVLRLGSSFHQVAGLRQMSDASSSALSWKNFKEVVAVFMRLAVEVKVLDRAQFNHLPQEIR